MRFLERIYICRNYKYKYVFGGNINLLLKVLMYFNIWVMVCKFYLLGIYF